MDPCQTWASTPPSLEPHSSANHTFESRFSDCYRISCSRGPSPESRASSNETSINENSKKETLFLQWNVRGFWCNQAELIKLVDCELPLAIGLQEMMTRSLTNTIKNRYNWILADRHYNQGGGAAALGILNEIPHQLHQMSSSIPTCVARLNAPYNLTIVSIYVPPNAEDEEVVSTLDNLTTNHQPPFVIGGDFNAAHEA